MHEFICSIMNTHASEIIGELLGLCLYIVSCLFIINNWIIVTKSIKAKSWWRTIMIVVNMGKNIVILDILRKRFPNHFHPLGQKSLLFVLVVNTGKEPGIEPHLRKDRSLCWRMAKGINMPADCRGDSKSIQQKLMAYGHLINNIFVVSGSFIIHTPPTIYELKLLVLNQNSHFVLDITWLL